MEKFGRLNAVKLSIVPSVVSSVITSLSTDVYVLILGRLLMGIGAALGTNPAVVYITEITSPEYRGALVSAGPTLSSLGMMIGYLSGAFLPWRTVSWINIGYSLIPLTLIYIFFVPESPPWLVSKERVEQARESLMWLARREDESVREKIVERKLKELLKDREEKLSKNKGQSLWQRMSGLKRPSGYKPMVIMIVLFAFQQYTGVYITTFYAVQFFESAGSSMNPFHASILIGLTRFIMSIVTVFLLKLVGRRPLCITSCIGMAVFMGVSGYYTRNVNQTGETSMIPVYSILLYVCFCMIGLLSLPWTMAAEVFPTEIRGLAHGLVIASAHLIMFLALKSYYQMEKFFGGHDYLQWFFSAMAILALVFVYLFLPETHKLTLFQIEDYFQNNTVYVCKKRRETADAPKRERRMSLKNVEILESLPENNAEYDTLVKQPNPINNNEKTYPAFDLSKIDYIDKSAVDLEKVS
ncbi:UNVERIFIED_CONTAM: hypothetical protein PYX00_004502 [Menopon gallinae]|uniref:Major facilitator superfamily (MFS) profile domain-containing protein n=1 Tax=Menopon gallinae TaxID=328185 RepID=A0AAW2I4P0_9NEOP